MGALALGLAASFSWGFADFVGGVEALRLTVLSVLLISQPVGLAAAAIWALGAGGPPLPLIDLPVGRGRWCGRRGCARRVSLVAVAASL